MTHEQQIRRLQGSVQQLSQRMVQMTRACESMQKILRANGINHPCLEVKFPLVADPQNVPELHSYDQSKILRAAGLLGNSQ